MNRKIDKLREEQAETKRARADGERKKDEGGYRSVLFNNQGSGGSGTRHEQPSGHWKLGNGVTRHGGERHTASQPQEIDVFPSNLQAHKKGHGLWASLKTNQGIGGQKFIWHCHNTAA